MSPLLREAWESLSGPRWQADVAKALGASARSVRRWAVDGGEVPPELVARLARICEDRIALLEAVRGRLRAASRP